MACSAGKIFLVGQIACGAEEDQGVEWESLNRKSPFSHGYLRLLSPGVAEAVAHR